MTHTTAENFSHLLDLNNQQGLIINKQNKIIARLINETVEKENFINELMSGQ